MVTSKDIGLCTVPLRDLKAPACHVLRPFIFMARVMVSAFGNSDFLLHIELMMILLKATEEANDLRRTLDDLHEKFDRKSEV